MEKPERIKTRFDGKQAMVVDKEHPHFSAIDTSMGVEFVGTLNKYGMVFKRIDTGEEFFVFNGKQTKWI